MYVYKRRSAKAAKRAINAVFGTCNAEVTDKELPSAFIEAKLF